MPITCQRCHTFTSGRIVRCAQCLRTGYCSIQCREQHAPFHQEKCTRAGSLAVGPEYATQGAGNGFSLATPVIVAPPNSIGGINQDWTSDLPRNQLLVPKAAERLINAFRFRQYEERQLLQQRGVGQLTTQMEQFSSFYKAMQTKSLLPTWWSVQCEQALFKIAFQIVDKSFTHEDAVRIQPLEPMVLRLLADKVYGPLHPKK